MKLTGTFAHKSWDEKTFSTIGDHMKATKATVEFDSKGDIEGVAKFEYLMYYSSYDAADPHKARASYIGLVIIEGKIKGKSGTFALTDNGVYDQNGAQSKLVIVPNSGTGELAKISGTGHYKGDATGTLWELEVSL